MSATAAPQEIHRMNDDVYQKYGSVIF